jgi:hypothetical protein
MSEMIRAVDPALFKACFNSWVEGLRDSQPDIVALVTIDAIGTQRAVAQTIRDRGGDYLLVLNRNWPATFAEVEAFFADPRLPPRGLPDHRRRPRPHRNLPPRGLPRRRLAALRAALPRANSACRACT